MTQTHIWKKPTHKNESKEVNGNDPLVNVIIERVMGPSSNGFFR